MDIVIVDRFWFIQWLKETKPNKIKFDYQTGFDDPCNPCGTTNKQASYMFYGITDKGIKLLVSKKHRRIHDDVKIELERKYHKWFIQYLTPNQTKNEND